MLTAADALVGIDLEEVTVRFAYTDLLGGILRRWDETVPLSEPLAVNRLLTALT